MAYQLYTKNQLGEIVAVTPGIDERVSNLESKAVETDLYKVDVREQTLTDEQKEQLVKNLDGTFLSLKGGNMTGGIVSTVSGVIRQATTSNHSLFMGGTNLSSGAYLAVFGKDWTDSRKGAFQLSSTDGNVTYSLLGELDGTLTWGGKSVERVEASGSNYIRFASGLQLCWSNSTALDSSKQNTITFPVPFSSNPAMVASLGGDINAYSDITVVASTTTGTVFCAVATSGSLKYFAAGFWK